MIQDECEYEEKTQKPFKQGSSITNLWQGLSFNIVVRCEAKKKKKKKKAEGVQSPEHIKKKNGCEDSGRQDVIWRGKQNPAKTEKERGR